MKKWMKNCKGAVTVFVTLLMIPAILLSGTGVDLARIYTAQSILRDANQLAANSVLTEYDALLQDLYGLFALTQDDEELRTLVNKYIETALYTSDGDQGGVGVLKLFYGSADPTVTVDFAEGKNLGNLDVLRRQIEEYVKIRGPVVLAEEVLSRLDAISKVKADATVISKKSDVEDRLEDVNKIYKDIYEGIKKVENYNKIETDTLDGIYEQLILISGQLSEMLDIREEYEEKASNSETRPYDLDLLIDHYSDVAANIPSILFGPTFGVEWEEDLNDPDHGDFTGEAPCGLVKYLLDSEDWIEEEDVFLSVEALYESCKKAEKQKEQLKIAVASLEEELDKNECSEELKKGITEPVSDEEQSLLDQYKSMADYDLAKLGKQYYDPANEQIKAFLQLIRDLYGSNRPIYYVGSNVAYKLEFFKDQHNILTEFDLNYNVLQNERGDRLADALDTLPIPISNPNGGYKNFQETGDENMAFFKLLESMYQNSGDGSEGEEKEKQVKGNITKLFNTLKQLFNQLSVSPDGAWEYQGTLTGTTYTTGSDFCGKGKDWGSNDKIKKDLKKSLDSDLLTKMGNVADDFANKALLLSYATEMFSCYTTGRGADSNPKSMSGIPYGVDVNYFYQSELEYIYHGNLSDAKANVDALGSMILLTRFVLNYVVSFSIDSVDTTVKAVKGALSFLGPFAYGIGELVRMGMALGESLTDLSLLRNGHSVALLKNNEDNEWHFSISEIASMAEDVLEKNVKDQVNGAESGGSVLDDDGGLYYVDYLRIFLLFVNGQDMTERIANLIALNMTNKTQNIGKISGENKNAARTAREKAMKEATLFDMSAARTDFTVTTQVEMSMMFLSMPFAQKGINGVVPPKSFTLSATDYRGY